jgi:large subunit ribosomal protein L6
MSRLGKVPIPIPAEVNVSVAGATVTVEGKKGRLTHAIPRAIGVTVEGNKILVSRQGDAKFTRAMHGTTRAHLANLVRGVSEGFEKQLEISGSGYAARMEGKEKLVLSIGLTHPVELKVPAGLTVECPSATAVTVRGPDRQAVGQFAAVVRALRPVEPYKLKGIKYRGEFVKKKAGKAAVGATK